MTRNLKRFGVALAAVFAMSVVAASAAYATPEYTTGSGTYPRNISGGQTTEHKFTAGIRTITCKTANFTGTISGKSSSQTITPEWKECTASGGLPVTVTVTGHIAITLTSVHFSPLRFTAHLKITGHFVVHIYASGAAHAEGKAPVCKITIGEQTLEGVTQENSGSGILTTLNVKPAITIEGSALVCGTGTTSTYTGSTQISAAGDTIHMGGE